MVAETKSATEHTTNFYDRALKNLLEVDSYDELVRILEYLSDLEIIVLIERLHTNSLQYFPNLLDKKPFKASQDPEILGRKRKTPYVFDSSNSSEVVLNTSEGVNAAYDVTIIKRRYLNKNNPKSKSLARPSANIVDLRQKEGAKRSRVIFEPEGSIKFSLSGNHGQPEEYELSQSAFVNGEAPPRELWIALIYRALQASQSIECLMDRIRTEYEEKWKKRISDDIRGQIDWILSDELSDE